MQRWYLILLTALTLAGHAAPPPVTFTVESRLLGEAQGKIGEHIRFSANAKHIAWTEYDATGACLVVDGVRSKRYTAVSFDGFTVDEVQYTATATNTTKNGCVVTTLGEYVIVNGTEYESRGFPVIAWRSGEMAYLRKEDGALHCVFHGTSGPGFDDIRKLQITDDGAHIAYVGYHKDTRVLVKDNKEIRSLLPVDDFCYSDDGRHFALRRRYPTEDFATSLTGSRSRHSRDITICDSITTVRIGTTRWLTACSTMPNRGRQACISLSTGRCHPNFPALQSRHISVRTGSTWSTK